MKKLLTILVSIILVGLNMQAQPPVEYEYVPIPTENAFWRSTIWKYYNTTYGVCGYHGFDPHCDWDCEYNLGIYPVVQKQFVITGDTLINELTYHKLWESKRYELFCVGDFISRYVGAFREDVINKKVYIYRPDGKKEELIYDFNINLGDDVSYFIRNGNDGDFDNPTVTDIDYILLQDGIYYKRFEITGCHGRKKYIVEGIGDMGGFLLDGFVDCYFDEFWGFGQSLNCFKINETWIFYKEPDNECFECFCDEVHPFVRISNIKKSNKLIIYPLPAKDFITISILENNINNNQLEILNYQGQCVIKQTLTLKYQQINIEQLPSGIYIVRVIDENGKMYVEKLLKY